MDAFTALVKRHKELQARADDLNLEVSQLRYWRASTLARGRPDGDLDWTPTESAGLSTFLATAPGRIMARRFLAATYEVALRGCSNSNPADLAHAAGSAHGWLEAYQWLLSLSKLSQVSGEQDTQTPAPGDSDANDERPLEGEAELLGRLSP